MVPMVKPEKIAKYSKSVLARVPILTPVAQKFLKISSYVGLHVGSRACSCGTSLGCSATEDRQPQAHIVCVKVCEMGVYLGLIKKNLSLDSGDCYCVR